MYPPKTVLGIDMRNLQANGGVIHCRDSTTTELNKPLGCICAIGNTRAACTSLLTHNNHR